LSFLLYCILQGRGDGKPCSLAGVNAQPVLFVTADGLSAAVSRISLPDLVPDQARILAYERVIAFLHRDLTVVPVRYGCVLDEERALVRHLREHGSRYRALLKELEGRVEMGIRILPSSGECISRDVPVLPPGAQDPHSGESGRSYLAARRAYYSQKERISEAQAAAVERVRKAFDGLFAKLHIEDGNTRGGRFALPPSLISLHFLIPAESVGEFRRRFHILDARDSAGLLLSGPWAPYNFVLPEEPQDPAAIAQRVAKRGPACGSSSWWRKDEH
jgi:hypothetical protein